MLHGKFTCSIFLFLVFASISFGGWGDVKPAIQFVDYSEYSVHGPVLPLIPRTVNLLNRRIMVVSVGNLPTWSVDELRYMLRDSVTRVLPIVAHVPDWTSVTPDPYLPVNYIIRLGLWNPTPNPFTNSEYSYFHRPPSEEGYYIWATNTETLITASTIRGCRSERKLKG
jgi:hypothetical protein